MLGDQAKSTKYTFWEHFLKQKILNNGNGSLHGRSFKGKGKLRGKLGGKRMAREKAREVGRAHRVLACLTYEHLPPWHLVAKFGRFNEGRKETKITSVVTTGLTFNYEPK